MGSIGDNDKVFLRKRQKQPTAIQKDVAGPILNAVAVLKMLRQALYEFSGEYDLRQHKKYDMSPDDCLILTEYGISELNRSTRHWYTQAATGASSSAALGSTAAVTAGSV
jgi:hypothetical protein